jgi:UDP-N-acetylglucosamine acyltransferase
MPTIIHPASIVEPGVELGENVNVGPFCVLKSGAKIGDNCLLYPGVVIESNTIIGKNNKIFHSAVIGGFPQDLKYKGEQTFVEIGDNNIIREFVTINRGTQATGLTKIGDGCLIMAYAHIAHDCRIGNNVIIANAVNMGGHVEIEDFAVVGGVVAIHQFVRVGRFSIVGGGLRITKDICPYIMVAGPPAQPAGINYVGLKRHNFPLETRTLLKRAYKVIFRSKFNTSEAVRELETNFPQTPEIKAIIDFISLSKRGLLKLGAKDD